MPITWQGPPCGRRGCSGPAWREGLCPHCWHLARLFGKDPRLFAYEPLHGYRDERDAVALPWQEWGRRADTEGRGVADLFARAGEDSEPPARPG